MKKRKIIIGTLVILLFGVTAIINRGIFTKSESSEEVNNIGLVNKEINSVPQESKTEETIAEEEQAPVSNITEETAENIEPKTGESISIEEYKKEHVFKTVSFSGMSFDIPEDWTTELVSSEDEDRMAIRSTDGNVVQISDKDWSLGSNLYTDCAYRTAGDNAIWDSCDSGMIDDKHNYLMARSVLDEQTASHYPQDPAGSVWQDLVIFGDDYMQMTYRQGSTPIDQSVALDYILETLVIE